MGIFSENTKKKLKNSVPIIYNMKPSFLVQIVIIILVILVLTLTSAYYMKNVNNFLSDDRKMYLDEVSKKNAETLRTQMQDDINTLKSISLAIDAYSGLNIDELITLLNKQTKLNNFKRISLTTPSGKTYSSDGKRYTVASPKCIPKSLKGESSVCGPLKDHLDGNNVFVYSIPVYKNKTLVCALSAVYDAESFVKDLDMSNFGEDAFFIITNKNGDMILNSNKPNSKNIKANIFDKNFYQRGEFKDYTKIKANESMFKTGKSGFIKFSDLEQEKILNYTPLKINDWYLLTIINTTNLNSKNQHIIQTTLALCMSAIVVITCLVILIRYLHTKNKREVETIYYMDNITRGNNFNKFVVDSNTILKHSHHKTYAVVTFDIDKFKYVNDVFGFDKGNQILELIYKIVDRNLKSNEVCCRVSHDIFSMLVLYKSDELLVKRLKKINENICTNVHEIINHRILINYGIHIIEDNTANINLLSDMSHMALKRAKGNFRTCFSFYDTSIFETLQEQVEIENSMESSLELGEFKVYLQPKYDLTTNGIVGAEALIRWHHPTKGIIPPDKFIPLFEKNRFISNIDRYVFKEVCITLRKWIDNGYDPLPISVNLSKVHIHNNKFISEYKEIMNTYSIPPSLIEIEFTESVAIYNIDVLQNTMDKLKDMGFLIAMDDFGAGYSSLNILKDIPVDVLKLDREFLSENFNTDRGKIILSSIVSMTKKLNIQIVSEGIETLSQANYMRSIGCDLAQGYYFDKPMLIEEFENKHYKNKGID